MEGFPEQPIDQHISAGPAKMSSWSQLGALLGLFGAGLVLSQIVVSVLLMMHVDMKSLDLEKLIDFNNPALMNSLKLGQLLLSRLPPQ